jgi:hypothetical protein
VSQPSEKSKDAALRAVGRTIVNFQRLEHNLKVAARLGPIKGTVQKVQRDIARRQERADSLTLGQAIQAWLTYCDGADGQVDWTPDLFDVSIHLTFSLESDAESRNAHAEELGSLLAIRNDLVHGRLAQFQWESPEACDALVLELTAVNAKISEQLEYVTDLCRAIQAGLMEYTESVVAAITGVPDAQPDGQREA